MYQDRAVAFKAVAVTPSDSTDLPAGIARAGLFITAAGNVAFQDGSGGTVTLTAVAANTRIEIAAKRVLAAGTSATVLALY